VNLLLLAGIGDFFNSIMSPLYTAIAFVMVWLYRLWALATGPGQGITWALAIMSVTVIVRTLLIPLFVRQINSARNMQLIQPKMKELQEKYGADRQRLGIETQKLMKEEGVNPMASCFPMLLQLPVFWALYQVLYWVARGSPRGYSFVHNPDLVTSLTQAKLWGVSLAGRFLDNWPSFGATQIMAAVLVVIMAALFFVTQRQLMGKNMPPEARTGTAAQQQKMMMYMFPAMYLFMGVMIPVGVLIYWVTNNLWTLGQQWLLIRNNPTPGTPAYVDWEERMIKQGRDPKAIAEARRAKRSKKVTQATNSRTVGTASGAGASTVSRTPGEKPGETGTTGGGGGTDAGQTPSASGVVRQQIQRQQPSRQSRSSRAAPKKK